LRLSRGRKSSGFSPSDNLPASIIRREFNERTESGEIRERTRVERSASETEGLQDRSETTGMYSRDIFVRDPRIRTLERPDAEKDCGSAGRGEMGRECFAVLSRCTDEHVYTHPPDEYARVHVYVHLRDSDAIANARGCVLLMVCAVLPDFHPRYPSR